MKKKKKRSQSFSNDRLNRSARGCPGRIIVNLSAILQRFRRAKKKKRRKMGTFWWGNEQPRNRVTRNDKRHWFRELATFLRTQRHLVSFSLLFDCGVDFLFLGQPGPFLFVSIERRTVEELNETLIAYAEISRNWIDFRDFFYLSNDEIFIWNIWIQKSGRIYLPYN